MATLSTQVPPDTSSPRSPTDKVESPGLSSSNANALARFEFEPGKSKDGTKILMIEWEDDETTRQVPGPWQISWEGKSAVLPAGSNEQTASSSSSGAASDRQGDSSNTGVRRLYFLLPPGVAVPSIVTLAKGAAASSKTSTKPAPSPAPSSASSTASSVVSSSSSASSSTSPSKHEPVIWRTHTLPAIFPPELGASARAAGKKGVLHTIWAKKRLQSLQREIAIESRTNAEGVGLQMAVQEKEWIELNFGVTARPAEIGLGGSGGAGSPGGGGQLASPTSPKSPGGGRLMEKLKGLKLATGEKDLGMQGSMVSESNRSGAQQQSQPFNPLSPETSDVAVSSFSAIRGVSPANQNNAPSPSPRIPLASLLERNLPQTGEQKQKQQQQQPKPPQRKMAAQAPPVALLAQQQRAGMASLDAFAGQSFDMGSAGYGVGKMAAGTAGSGAGGNNGAGAGSGAGSAGNASDDREDDLFALPISPRSPDMAKSPFSFAARDTMKYAKDGTVS